MRRLSWPECRNVRDVGGLPTVDGGAVRAGALVRADSLHRLTPEGLAALRAHGIRRVVDLRSADEARECPGPLTGDPMYRLLPLIDPVADTRRVPEDEPTRALTYCGSLTRNGSYIAAGLAAVADAPEGGVLVHCAAGRDRTGMVVALALRVAGVADEVIAEDYAYSGECLDDPETSEPETILTMLRHLDATFGDAAAYLRTHGLTEDQVTSLRQRLR
ncbi:tyrosine-protein phosphatase [Dactylosporangium fulvum]|uniref:Tyrosine-protein phosphatase n=1 Tax=Dactylosporangium fulvum TaxID=53359 RepID=A0ABY5WCL3_9ACTN|nr:tyrosine-protein phosphatase [Dactylosporangium fulvum]UWP87155.1 tyrosine-protein phosphatase [Dactylosporangium fulvum]